LTKLHAGAKFGNSSYTAVGGLHGVGSSVVNALSSRLDVEVDRDGKTHRMRFHQGHPGIYQDPDPERPSPDSPFKRTRKNRPTPLEVVGSVPKSRTGTRVRYWADPEIFNPTARFSYAQLIDRVRQTSFLVPGLKITVIDDRIPATGSAEQDLRLEVDGESAAEPDNQNVQDDQENLHGSSNSDDLSEEGTEGERAEDAQPDDADLSATERADRAMLQPEDESGHQRVEEFLHTGGVTDFVDFLSKGEPVSDIWRISGQDTYQEETQRVGSDGELHAEQVERVCGVDIALRWVNDYDSVVRSFVNVVETPGGGMHVDGFMNAMTRQVRKAVEANARRLKVNLKDSHTKVERDDVLAGLVAVVTVRIAEPQFQGQTKDVLGTAQVKPIVTRMTDDQFGQMISGSKRGFKEQSG
ncbi:MAG: DNA topoisomerase IV subunit B, partial [Bifidobacteriales bacterium]|nr:DNA topoisomerase IV subunit B [Bifidobacteriales bacterium]